MGLFPPIASTSPPSPDPFTVADCTVASDTQIILCDTLDTTKCKHDLPTLFNSVQIEKGPANCHLAFYEDVSQLPSSRSTDMPTNDKDCATIGKGFLSVGVYCSESEE